MIVESIFICVYNDLGFENGWVGSGFNIKLYIYVASITMIVKVLVVVIVIGCIFVVVSSEGRVFSGCYVLV